MGISGINGSTMPDAIHDLKSEVNQIRAHASANPPSTATFQQDVKEVHNDVHALRQALATLKSEAQGALTPASPGDAKAVRQDFAALQSAVKNLASAFGDPVSSPPQPGPTAGATGVDVMA